VAIHTPIGKEAQAKSLELILDIFKEDLASAKDAESKIEAGVLPHPARQGEQGRPVDGHLGRVGAGDKVRGGEQVEEHFAAHPAAPAHHFVFHHGDVRRGSAERGRAQAEKEQGDFAQARPRNWRGMVHRTLP
jgi:hypothetical protein